MPCRDYEDTIPDWYLRNQNNRLARIACRALEALEAVDPQNDAFKDLELAAWWTNHKIADVKEQARLEKEKQARLKMIMEQLGRLMSRVNVGN
jgi:hypothetical protein